MSFSNTISTFTPLSSLLLPAKSELRDRFVGCSLDSIRTPALVIDRQKFKENCESVTAEAKRRGMDFRIHVKTHKTFEGTRMQVEAAGGVKAVICSTMVEVWQVVESGLVEEGKVDDILYSLPIAPDRIEDLNDAQSKVGSRAVIRVMIDHPDQLKALDEFSKRVGRKQAWSAFIKVDGGGKRAGNPPESEQMKEVIKTALSLNSIAIFGFYSHFGQSYASSTLDQANKFYHSEIDCVNAAAKIARGFGAKGDWVLSVGATPTAHAAVQNDEGKVSEVLEDKLELHAGNYCICDLQQFATSLVPKSKIASTVLATVVSNYPHRNEAMCDAGAIAVSKDSGPLPGCGHIVYPPHATGWDLGRISQEHGTLVHRPNGTDPVNPLKVGDKVRIVPQHACLVLAAYPWFYVTDGGDEVVDVWVPWKGW